MDGRLFNITKTTGSGSYNLTSPTWYPMKSNFTIESILNSGVGDYVTTYPLKITPSSGNVKVSTINSFNTSLPGGSTIMSITVNSTNVNEVNFILSNLYPGGKYAITKDEVNVSTHYANNSGEISWTNSLNSTNVNIAVKSLYNPPVITSFEPANGSIFIKGQKIKIALNASNEANQTLSYTLKIDGTVYSKLIELCLGNKLHDKWKPHNRNDSERRNQGS